MIAPMLDTCILCGRRTRKPGEGLCVFHDVQALIELGYYRTLERLNQQRVSRLSTFGAPLAVGDRERGTRYPEHIQTKKE
jgi:hypothetical protein